MTVEITGLDALEEILERMGPGSRAALGSALYQEATEVLNASQLIVPVDTGDLKASGMVTEPTDTGTGVEVIVGYGGSTLDYALTVHEDLNAWHEEGSQAKYLEQPALEAVEGMGMRLAIHVASRGVV